MVLHKEYNIMRNRFPHQQTVNQRTGVAALELALALPLLVLMMLGTIDLGQFVNVGQVISNASRVGARKAALSDTKTVAEVESEVVNYLNSYFPKQSASTLQNATTVSVSRSDGTSVSSNALGSITTGEKLQVTVRFDYSATRWIQGLSALNGGDIQVTTTIRKM